MRGFRLRTALLVALGVALACAGTVGSGRSTARGTWIVVFADGVDGPRVLETYGGQPQVSRVYRHALNGMAVEIPRETALRLAGDRRVVSVEPDGRVYATAQVVPPGISRIKADQNTVAKIDGVDERVDVDVAVIDSGIDLDHEDLNVVYDQSFILGVPTGDDDAGHGTHVAGTIAALDNDIGVVGVAPGARLWALKALDATGSGNWSDLLAALDFVAANAAEIEVVNMSLGGILGPRSALQTAIQNCVNQGVVVVVAAGNEYMDVYGWDGVYDTWDDVLPACFPEVCTVSAMCDTDGQAGGTGAPYVWPPPYPWWWLPALDDTFVDFSNYSASVVPFNPVTSLGAAIDLAAPGVGVYSSLPDDSYDTYSGTSMAAPHVAGAAALYIAEHGRAADAVGVAAIRQALINLGDHQVFWGPANTLDPDANHEYLVDVDSGPRPPLPPSLTLSVTTNKGRYRIWDRAIIATAVSSSGTPVAGATVTVEITTPRNRKFVYTTSAPYIGNRREYLGTYVVYFYVRPKTNGFGAYRIQATATKGGYMPGQTGTTFLAQR